MSSTRANETLQSVTAALQSGRIASMPEIIRIIRTMAQDDQGVTVGDLAELIQQDSTVLVKVISAANTLGYNPTGAKISTIPEAIQIIGFSRVRRLAMSLLLIEQSGRSTTPTEQREMAAVSLCSGLIAQVAAEQMTLVDPEQAFVCAALRNFGRLVLGTFMTDEFREARDLATKDGNDDEAFRTVFGLTPLELGYELLRSSALPDTILNAVRDIPPNTLEQAAWAERRLAHLTRFSLQLSEIVLNPNYDVGRFGMATTELVRRYSSEIPLLTDIFPDLLRQAEARLSAIARSAGSAGLDKYGLDRMRRRVRGDNLPPRPVAPIAAPTRPGTAGDPNATPVSLEEACELLAQNQNPREGLRTALATMHRSLEAQESFFCALDPIAGEFNLQLGHGPLSRTLLGKSLFRRHERNVFLLCHERLENVVVRDASDPKLLPYLPAWLRTAQAPRSFVLLPVHHQGRVHGVMLVGWTAPRNVLLSPERVALIRRLLAFVARAAMG